MNWKRFFRRKRFEEELEQEIRAHLAMDVQQRIERGEQTDDARANAYKDFGNVALVKDTTRDVWGRRWLDEIRQDVSYAIGTFVKNPGFTLIAIGTLGLGIGATTTIFTVTNAVLLRPLPYREPDRLVAVWKGHVKERNLSKIFATYRDFEGWKRNSRSVEELAAAIWAHGGKAILTNHGSAREVVG